jgi:hypothetical protein
MFDDPTFLYYFRKVFDLLMIFTPNIGFIAQIIKFRKMKSSQGFSKLMTFTILTSNILRIFFWIGKRFALALLFQSLMSIVMQMFLLNECLKFSTPNLKNKKEMTLEDMKVFTQQINNLHRPISILDVKNFWDWPHLVDYVYIIVLFSLTLGFISNIIGFDNLILVESFGIGSAGFEAIVGIPQIIQNFKNKHTENLSVMMIMTWMTGDVFKTVYFIKTRSPLQMICCGLFQITTDTILILQIICFYKNTRKIIEYKRLSSKENNDQENTSKKSPIETATSAGIASDTDSRNEEFTNVV